MKRKNPTNLLCIDFESWIVSREINKAKLTDSQLRNLDNNYTPSSLDFLLKLLKTHQQKITFFVVFKLEKIYPGLIEKILADGHEIGWHGYTHHYLNNRSILKRELLLSEPLLKQHKVRGFQAPNIEFFKSGYGILKNYGFTYSSSIYGNSSMIYNFDGITEIPVSTTNSLYNPSEVSITFPSNMSITNIFKFGLPYGSSFFWSVLGKKYYERKLKEASRNNYTVNLFIHNWQLVTPRSQSARYKPNEQRSFLSNPLYYPYKINVAEMFEYLIKNFRFQRCIDYVENIKSQQKI